MNNSNDYIITKNGPVAIVDMDYFFAQCEELRDISLKGKPVIVCMFSGRTEEAGAVATANYVARKLGVRAGMPVYNAKKLAPTASLLRADIPYYRSISEDIIKALRRNFSKIEVSSIDEAYIDISSSDWKDASGLGKRIKAIVKEASSLNCTVGIGPNKLIAKVASDQAKPDGLLIIEPEKVSNFLKFMPIEKIPFVGKKTEEKLNSMNIKLVSDALNLSLQQLEPLFGQKHAEFLYKAFRGIDDRPFVEHSVVKQIGRIVSLRKNNQLDYELNEKIPKIVSDIIKRMDKMAYQNINVIVIFDDLTYHNKSKTLPLPSTDDKYLLKEGGSMIKDIITEYKDRKIRRIGISVGRLKKIDIMKMDHFFNDLQGASSDVK